MTGYQTGSKSSAQLSSFHVFHSSHSLSLSLSLSLFQLHLHHFVIKKQFIFFRKTKPSFYSFQRLELATSLETKSRFPELVVQEEKRIRFVVAIGLDIVERPNIVPTDDVEWFKHLTGSTEVAITSRD